MAAAKGSGGAVQGDAEDLPFDTDSFDRYVSAGSIGAHPTPCSGLAHNPANIAAWAVVWVLELPMVSEHGQEHLLSDAEGRA